MRKHFLILMLLTLVSLAGWAGNVVITPHVINVYYPAPTVDEVVITVDNFDISGDIPAGFAGETEAERKAAAKANLLHNLQVTIVAGADMPAVTGSVKYYFSVVGDDLDEKWAETNFTMANNGDLNVLPRDLATVTFFVPDGADVDNGVYTYTYNGSAKTPTPIVCVGAYDPNDASNQLAVGTDFAFTYIHNINATGVVEGTAPNTYDTPQIKIVPATNTGYTGYKTLDFDINPKEFGTDVTIADITGATYNGGTAVKPALTVTDAAISATTPLTLDVDYEIDLSYDEDGWKNNINATPASPTADQLASVKIKGKGNYEGTSTLIKTFSIAKKNIADNDIDWNGVVAQLNYPVAADAQAAANIRWHGDDAAIEGIDYELSNTSSIGLGTITASVNANGAAAANYTGTKTTNFEIIPGFINQDVTIAFKKPNPEFDPNVAEGPGNLSYLDEDMEFIYRGEEIKPGTLSQDGIMVVTKTVNATGYVLKAGVDYEIVANGYKNNINAALYNDEKAPTVTIKGIGNYDAVDGNSQPLTQTGTFTIGKRPIKVTANSVTKVYHSAEINFGITTNIVAADYDNLAANEPTYQVLLYTTGAANPTVQNPDETTGYSALRATTKQVGEGENEKWCFVENNKDNWYTILPNLTFKTQADVEAELADEYLAENPEATEEEIAAYVQAHIDEAWDDDAVQAARANYDFETEINYTEGKLKVEKASYVIAVVDRSKIYGSTTEPGTYEEPGNADASVYDDTKDVKAQNTYYTYQVLKVENETETVVNVVPETTPKIGRKLATNEEELPEDVKDGGYTIYVLNAENDGTFDDPNYNFTVRTGILTIEPFKLTLVANDQTIKYGAEINDGVSATDKVKDAENGDAQGFGNKLTVTFSPAMTGKGLISRAELDLQLDVAEAFDGTIKTHENVIIPSLGADVKNYVIDETTLKLGAIKVISAGELVLGRTDAKCHDLIKDYDTMEEVTVKFEARELKAETWQAMAFPFDLTVAEFSNAIYEATGGEGYAVVNILNEENTAEKPAFKLWMREIPANTPFLFKVYTGKTGETLNTFDMEDLQFEDKTIAYVEQAESHDAAGNYFYGLYKVTTVTNDGYTWLFNHNTGKFGKFGKKVGEEYVYDGQTSRDLNPLTGYLKTATQIDQFARITVVEEDGTVTAISTINADGEAVTADGWYNLNGVKLQGMPTEKGVYIQNGKKVVLK